MENDRPRVLIVEARFYNDIADELVRGAIEVLDKAGCDYERIEVPGVFEIPGAVRFAIKAMEAKAVSKPYAGFVTLGCVIRGETDHYDHVCRESSRAMMNLTLDFTVAHGFGVLTVENQEQAWVRAKVDQKNHGGRAAEACLCMMELKRKFHLVHR